MKKLKLDYVCSLLCVCMCCANVSVTVCIKGVDLFSLEQKKTSKNILASNRINFT